MNELEQMIIEFTEAFGPSGFEGEVRAIFEKMVRGSAVISYDHFGGILAVHHGRTDQPKVMLAAHLDEVGLMVRGILPGGELKVVPLGGWWVPSLMAQPVIVRSSNGDHYGVIGAKPPHYLKEEEKNRPLKLDDLFVDVGAESQEAVMKMGIEPGDPIVPAVKTVRMSSEYMLMGKAFDDRVGCAAMAKVLRELDDRHPNQVIAAGTVQEESGLRGAKAISPQVQPDVCIVLEGTPADDFPGGGPIIQGRLGGGPQIRRYDPTMIANQVLVNLIIQAAKEMGLPYQVAVRDGGGTDASAIQIHTPGGVPTTVIGVPVRYAHSHHGIISLKDLDNTIKLVKALIPKLDEATVAKIQQNPW